MKWLRLHEAAARFENAGLSPEAARAAVTDIVRRAHRGTIRLPAQPNIPQSYGVGWLVQPHLDFAASTIIAPCRGEGATWSSFETRPRPVVIEVAAHAITTDARKKPGPQRTKGERVEGEMRRDIEIGKFTFSDLARMKKDALGKQYGVARNTANDALKRLRQSLTPKL